MSDTSKLVAYLRRFECRDRDGNYWSPQEILDAADRLEQLEAENTKLRKILAHVPGRIAIKAKEDAGYGAEIRAMDKRIDDRMEAQQAEYEMGLDADHESDDQ